MGEIINGKRLGGIFGVTPRTVTDWRKAGMPVHDDQGRGKGTFYDTAACFRWLLARDGSVGKDPGTVAARRRLLEIEGNRREIRLSLERGESVPLAIVGSVWQRAIGAFKARSLSIPRKAVMRLRGAKADPAREKVLTEMICEALDELAVRDYSPDILAAVKEAGYQVEEGAGGNNIAAKVGDPKGDNV